MQELTRSSIAALLTAEGTTPKVTIYAPMQVTATPPHMTENQIRFKNLIHQATHELTKRADPASRELAKTLSDQLTERLNDVAFWESQAEGLLLCATPGLLELFHLPVDTEEYVAVDTCYHLAPVLALLGDEQSFYVLAIAQHQPKLFAGSLYGLCEMEVSMPESIAASLNLDESGQSREQSRAMGNGIGFNGRGGRRDPREEERLRFFRLIDDITTGNIERNAPLVLAGTESDLAEYRAISKHPHILTSTIAGSFSGAKAHNIFPAAYDIVYQEIILARRQAALETYRRLQGTQKERIATDPLAIAEAAKQGRIDTLLVSLRRTTTDTIRDTARAVERITFPRTEVSTLVNKAANAVANASGRIINVEIGSVAGSPVMALLRY